MEMSHPFPAQAEAEEKSREAERRLEAATAAALRRGEDTETAAMAVLQRQVQEAQDAEEALSARFFEHGKGLNDARKALGEAVWGDADKYSEEGVPTWPRYLPHRWVADATGDAARASRRRARGRRHPREARGRRQVPPRPRRAHARPKLRPDEAGRSRRRRATHR